MELRNLEAFVQVVQCGGFTAAADRLGTTQPTVSKLLAQLERELGEPLLQRPVRRALPTDVGRLVLGHAERMLREAASIRAGVADLRQGLGGELRIGVPPLGPQLFVPLIHAFKLRHPGIELKLYEDGSRAIEQAMLAGELELGGLLAPLDDRRYEHLMLIDDRLALLAPARSRWSRHPVVRLAELAEEPLILFLAPYMLNERIDEACRQCGFTPQIAGRSGQIGFILELVRSGVGVALLPGSELPRPDAGEFAVSALVEPEIAWRIDLAWLRGAYLSHAARAWLQVVREHLAAARPRRGEAPMAKSVIP